MIDQNTMLLGGSLLGLIILNIILGSVNSLFQKQFDKAKLWQGIFKGFVVSFSFICVCFIGQLNPNILLISVDGKEINLSNATYLLMMSGYLYYGKEVLIKLSSFVSGKFKIDENSGTIDQKSLINSPVTDSKISTGTIPQTDNSETK